MSFDRAGKSSPSSAAKALRWDAVSMLCWMLPRPYNYNSYVGWGLRKLRLEKELAEFDYLHRLKRGRPALLDELVCAGMLLLSARKGAFPPHILPLDEDLLVNRQSFDGLVTWIRERLELVHRS